MNANSAIRLSCPVAKTSAIAQASAAQRPAVQDERHYVRCDYACASRAMVGSVHILVRALPPLCLLLHCQRILTGIHGLEACWSSGQDSQGAGAIPYWCAHTAGAQPR